MNKTPGRYCPACLSEEVITDYTRQTPRGTLRRKHCKDCGHVFSTMECLVGAQIPPIPVQTLVDLLEQAGVAIECPGGFRKTDP